MSMIYASQVLELLAKATKLHIPYEVYEYDDEYSIQFKVDWYAEETNSWGYETVIITKNSQSRWSTCWDFDSFMVQLDAKLKEQEQEAIKAEKRKELLERLTSEELELLGLGSSSSVSRKTQLPF